MDQEDYERLLGRIDAIQEALVQIARALPSQARNGIAAEIDVYGSRAERHSSLPARAEGLRDTAWSMAERIWAEKSPKTPLCPSTT